MAPTGTLEVALHGDIKTYEWNGNPDDRAVARAAFDEMTSLGGVLAVVKDAPQKGHQVRTFDEVEQVERERGVVEVSITPGIVGG